MELTKFISNFANQFDDTDLSEFKADTIFQGLEEWSSLTMLSIIAMIRTEYNKTITAKEIRSTQSIEDLFKIVEAK